MSRVVITTETVSSARQSLPPAASAVYNVMDIEVIAADGQPAMIEFERILIRHEDGSEDCWSWEAMTCWSVVDAA